MTARAEIRTGDAVEQLRTLDAGSIQCCVTSPPYWGLRDYGVAGQLGLEPTPDAYVQRLVQVFSEVRRVLRDDGTVWLNLGDSYAANRSYQVVDNKHIDVGNSKGSTVPAGLKAKDLIGVPWRVAFALQAAGWYLRSDIIWSKPNPMPESVRDRPTKAHEYVFLLSKQSTYYYDAESIAEPLSSDPAGWGRHTSKDPGARAVLPRPMFGPERNGRDGTEWGNGATRNARSVWPIATIPFPEAHFATMPVELAQKCIRAGSSNRACEHCGAPWERVVEKGVSMWEQRKADGAPMRHGDVDGGRTNAEARFSGATLAAWKAENPDRLLGWQPTCRCENQGAGRCVVLDPFGGAGTTGLAAVGLGRNALLIELNPSYAEMARRRITSPLFEEAAS